MCLVAAPRVRATTSSFSSRANRFASSRPRRPRACHLRTTACTHPASWPSSVGGPACSSLTGSKLCSPDGAQGGAVAHDDGTAGQVLEVEDQLGRCDEGRCGRSVSVQLTLRA